MGVCLAVLGMEPGPPILGKHSTVELLLDLALSLFLIELCLASAVCLLDGISLFPSSCVEDDR